MKMPFTVEHFFAVFARYNEAVWPMQILLNLLAIAVIVMLFRPRQYSGRAIAAVLSLFWAWMAVAYHFSFFAAINPAAWLFGSVFLMGALYLAWVGVLKNNLRFALGGDIRRWLGGLLILFALAIYPLLGSLFGHHYPAMPTFGLPCPTTIFTIGVLLLAVAPYPRAVFIVPLLWSAVGSVAAFTLGVYQDYGLLAAGLIGLAAVVYPPKRNS
ncbi:MAG: DUF6064 family protein [Syntrophales bacterium]